MKDILFAFIFLIQFVVNLITKQKPSKFPKKRNKEYPQCSLINDLKKCDIIAYRFKGKLDIVGGIISNITNSPYSHVEIHIKDGHDISATENGVGFVDLYKNNIDNGEIVDIFRLKSGLTREEENIIISKAYQTVLFPYDYVNLFAFPFLGKKLALKLSGNHAFICSEHIYWLFDNLGIQLKDGGIPSIQAPCDITLSDKLEYIGTYKHGVKLYDNLSNKFMEYQIYGKTTKIISNIIKKLSSVDDYYIGVNLNKREMI